MSRRGSRKPRARSGRVKRVIKRSLVLVGILFCAFAAAGLCIWIPIYQKAVRDASQIDSKLVVRSSNPSVIVSSNGTVLYRIESQRRNVVDVMSLPKYVRDAVVAAEDRRFYDHHGVDYRGLIRISFLAAKEGHTSQGASTLEMQLAKKLVNGDERSFQRKLKDIATAQQIENLKTKDQILNLYMNEVYFGQGAYGIDAAAQIYFGKPAAKLDIAEAAMLARCVRHPSRDNPVRDPKGSIDRRDYVLGVMRDEGWISNEQYETAIEETPKISKSASQGIRYLNQTAGYFVDHVLQKFHDDNPSIDLQEGGYRIETTLNYKLQQEANEAVAETLRENRGRLVTDAAFVMVDSDGKILAEVGGPNYRRRKYNVITTGTRQPGSSFKPFVYATALKEGIVHMGDMLSNEPIYEDRYGVPWNPKNNGRERVGGSVSLTTAFASSINLPAIHTIQRVTPETVVSYAKDTFGFTSRLHPNESLAIGTSEVNPLEMARAYSVFMLKGDRIDPYPIEKIVGPDGDVLKSYSPSKVSTDFDPNVCAEIDELMRDVVIAGTGTAASEVPDARGKTGTTQDAKDAWFCGYSDGLIGIGWVGNSVPRHGRKDASRSMASSVYGGTVTAGMWAKVMLAAHDLHLSRQPPAPAARVASRSVRKPQKEEDDDDNPDTIPDASKGGQAIPAPPTDISTAPDDSAPTTAVPDNPQPKPKAKDRKKKDPNPPASDTSNDANPRPPPDPSDDAQQTRRSAPKSRDDDSEYVEVEICADTGMRASRYCPETKTVRFRKGTEPRQICRLHTGN